MEQVEVKGAKGKPNVVVSKDDGLSKVTTTLFSPLTQNTEHTDGDVLLKKESFTEFGREWEGGRAVCVAFAIPARPVAQSTSACTPFIRSPLMDHPLWQFNPEKLRQLRPCFKDEGTVTAGTSSTIR